jgi:hypothetical protein
MFFKQLSFISHMGCDILEVRLDPEKRAEHILRNMHVEGMDTAAIRHCVDKYSAIVRQKQPQAKSDATREKLEKILRFLSGIRQRVGEGSFIEDKDSCYCGLPLSKVPEEDRNTVIAEHLTIKRYIEQAGLRTYDPAEAPFNPQGELVGVPQEIFDVDNLMVLASKFFEFTNIEASTGAGIEQRTAMLHGKMPIVMAKKGVYVTRMSTGARRILLLEYDDVEAAGERLTGFIGELKRFTPGIGTCRVHGNALIGFENGAKSPVCLHGLSEELLPDMQYDFEAYRK